MRHILYFLLLLFFHNSVFAQSYYSSCSHEAITSRHQELDLDFETELNQTELELQGIISDIKSGDIVKQRSSNSYIIPVVMHVFHWGDEGKINMEQARSGIEIMNQDFAGLNDGWNDIDHEFDDIKGTLDITFCLAQIDPNGNTTTGVVYHENNSAHLNEIDLFEYAWDNYKYLNIYLPKYTNGAPSNFTAFAYYPSTSRTNQNKDGIFYSSIRWGFGDHSILEEGDDWASVCTHEVGHWLNLRHTFQNGCSSQGDLVDDTPPTLGGDLQFVGCNNNDYSCSVPTNGENFMDYNLRCKKMFTKGQIKRMEAALYLPSRINIWSQENLVETGCSSSEPQEIISEFSIYPNPARHVINIKSKYQDFSLKIYNASGQLIASDSFECQIETFDISQYQDGIYFLIITTQEETITKKISICN